MRRISSRLTWWYKKAFPTCWFGFFGLCTLILIAGVIEQKAAVVSLLAPLGMAVVGYLFMRWLIFPLVDAVWIDETDLVVRNGGAEDRFPLTNVIDVENPRFMNPERVILMLNEPCRFGREIVFLPPTRSAWRFSRHPIAEELIRRAHGIAEEPAEEGDGADRYN